MAKLTTTDVSNIGGNPTGAATAINNNFELIETALENTLSRDGTSPNSMGASIDMNSNRIINLPAPASVHEPLRLGDVLDVAELAVEGLFSKVTDDSDDIVEGTGKMFVTSSRTLDNLIVSPPDTGRVTNANVYPPNVDDDESNRYMNIAISPGTTLGDTGVVGIRSTAVGTYNGLVIEEWNRVDAFGHCALMFSEYANRCTALGSDTMPWGGITSRQKAIDYKHDFYRIDLPNDGDWDFDGLETLHAGVGARIWAHSDYANEQADFQYNVAAGRDGLLHLVCGTHNTTLGYQGACHLYYGSLNTAIGALALRNGVFNDNETAVGYSAGRDLIDGGKDVIIGYRAGADAKVGVEATIIGGDAGLGLTTVHGSVLLGHQAGVDLGPDVSDFLVIANARNNTRAPLISGNFSTPKVGINVAPASSLGTLHLRVAALTGFTSLNSGAAALLIERDNDTGITIATPAANTGWLMFGDPDANNVGGIGYGHSSNNFTFRLNSGTRATLSATGVLDVTGSYSVDGTQVLTNRITGWGAATGTATRTTFATGSVTTAQLAERVKALIDDLITHGVIGT